MTDAFLRVKRETTTTKQAKLKGCALLLLLPLIFITPSTTTGKSFYRVVVWLRPYRLHTFTLPFFRPWSGLSIQFLGDPLVCHCHLSHLGK